MEFRKVQRAVFSCSCCTEGTYESWFGDPEGRVIPRLLFPERVPSWHRVSVAGNILAVSVIQ
uniref:Uncharacterized protein n=1 Tax=Anguilla anguilla TaxID=7936 RepID=A0A0E9WUE5_ANGAN